MAAERRSRRWNLRVAGPLLLLGGVLLVVSVYIWINYSSDRSPDASAAPATTPSTVMVTRTAPPLATTPSPGATPPRPTVTVLPSVITVTLAQASAPADSSFADLTALITAVSGLLASAAGLITALASNRSRGQ